MLSGVSVIYLRIYQELIFISYHEQKKGKNVLGREWLDLQIKKQFSTSTTHHDSNNPLL